MVKLNDEYRPSGWSDEDWAVFQNRGETPIKQGEIISMQEIQAQVHRNEMESEERRRFESSNSTHDRIDYSHLLCYTKL